MFVQFGYDPCKYVSYSIPSAMSARLVPLDGRVGRGGTRLGAQRRPYAQLAL